MRRGARSPARARRRPAARGPHYRERRGRAGAEEHDGPGVVGLACPAHGLEASHGPCGTRLLKSRAGLSRSPDSRIAGRLPVVQSLEIGNGAYRFDQAAVVAKHPPGKKQGPWNGQTGVA